MTSQYWPVFTIVELQVQSNQADILLFNCMNLFDETIPWYDRINNIIVQHEWFHINFIGWLAVGTDILVHFCHISSVLFENPFRFN